MRCFSEWRLSFVERITELVTNATAPIATLRKIEIFFYPHLDAHPECATTLDQVAANGAEWIEGLRVPLRHREKSFHQGRDAIAALLAEGNRQRELPESVNASAGHGRASAPIRSSSCSSPSSFPTSTHC